jgi:hypothetical protein
MASAAAPAAIVLWLRRLRAMDELSRLLVAGVVSVGWALAVSRARYENPLTDHKPGGLFAFWSGKYTMDWVRRFPVGEKKLTLADVPKEVLAVGESPLVEREREAFLRRFEFSGGSSYRALKRMICPAFLYVHLLKLPELYASFLPPLVMGHLLRFLEDPNVPAHVGLQLAAVAAVRRVISGTCQAMNWPVGLAGYNPIQRGMKAALIQRAQEASPRGRGAVSTAELQTMVGKLNTSFL